MSEERFWAHGRRDAAGCLLWTGALQRGYGWLTWNRKQTRAHRVAWTLACGSIPSGLCVLHRCDTPACFEPSHLFLGTQTDNMRDSAAKGRQALQRNPWLTRGERHPNARLAPEQVRAIRTSYGGRYGQQTQLALEYGVTRQAIGDIVSRRKWAQL